jgi:hypothetical protein
VEWVNQPHDGKETLIDTTKVQNGVYSLGVSATYEGALDSNPWLAVVQTQLTVEN